MRVGPVPIPIDADPPALVRRCEVVAVAAAAEELEAEATAARGVVAKPIVGESRNMYIQIACRYVLDGLKSGSQVWCILFLLLLTTSAST